ncbi:hypothetical protein [Deinococcus fonticola]|uniref:hypothetical protein n=1 Tax=Deinococcus fonticola TaxID=2528713 RepID=UPI001430EFBD|nr:hypothetical protein [Deinococcus fonticola]
MSALFILLALVLAVVAFVRSQTAQARAQDAERKANLLREELLELRATLNLPPSVRLGEEARPAASVPPPQAAPGAGQERPTPSPDVPAAPSSPQAAPVFQPRSPWPEDQPGAVFQAAAPGAAASLPAAASPRAPMLTTPAAHVPAQSSLWGPEYSRARISVFGGALVLGGLAFTLRALGWPAWTLLLAVFAFGAVLYGTARLVPWPVSGALRGLGYGVSALGLGSLAQKFPQEGGPAIILLGLLLLSAALTWDGLRRREPLLGVMALGGASLSVWMLADDLNRLSIPAAGAVFVLSAAALLGARPSLKDSAAANASQEDDLEGPDNPQAWRAALTLTLTLTGLLPLGWLVAAVSHVLPRLDLSTLDAGDLFSRAVLTRALHLNTEPVLGMALWVGFSLLALLPVLTLLRSTAGVPDADDVQDSAVRLAAVWASVTPQALVGLALGLALSRHPGFQTVLAPGVFNLLVLAGAAWWGWRHHRHTPRDPEDTLAGTLASSLTAGATGLAAALLVALLGARTEPAALAGLALTVLVIGLHGHSRLWVWLGALALAGTALWGLGTPGLAPPWAPFLQALPALIAVVGALRAAFWQARHRQTPDLAWLAGLGGGAALLGLSSGPVWPVLGAVLGLAALLWLTQRTAHLFRPVQNTLYWAALPGLLVGSVSLLGAVDTRPERLALLLGAVLAALVALLTAHNARTGQALVEGVALALLTFALALLPDGNAPHLALACALVALLAAGLPLKLAGQRVPALLVLGAVAAILSHVAWIFPQGVPRVIEWLGTWALLLVGWLTLDSTGRDWLASRLPASSATALRQLPGLTSAQQTWWFGFFLALAVSAGLFVWPAMHEWWLLAGSTAAMLMGISACVRAARLDGDLDARAHWTAGLWLVSLAGLKGATLDALNFSNPRAVAGLAVLVTGLSLLLLAVLAPRPNMRNKGADESPETSAT